jgi:hypothetical protein
MSETKTTESMGFIEWLQLAFIILKLTKYIDWSWWWVLSPTLIGLAIGLLLIVLSVLRR